MVLFDEIEKAHADVFNILLQVTASALPLMSFVWDKLVVLQNVFSKPSFPLSAASILNGL